MGPRFKRVLFAVLLAVAIESRLYASPASTGPALCIHLYNPAHLRGHTVAQAIAATSRIFERAGIATNWEQPPLVSREAHVMEQNLANDRLPSGERPCLVIRLTGTIQAGAYPGALGFSLPFATSGIDVEIFINRIEAVAETSGVADYVILAGTIAHEMGHVLLQSSAHSGTGLMQGRWSTETWRMASYGMIGFLPKEARALPDGLRRFRCGREPQDSRTLSRSAQMRAAGMEVN